MRIKIGADFSTCGAWLEGVGFSKTREHQYLKVLSHGKKFPRERDAKRKRPPKCWLGNDSMP